MTQCRPTDRPTDGVIVAEGGSSEGFTLYAKEGKLIYEYNLFGKERTTIASDSDLPRGKVQVSMNYLQKSADKNDPLAGGTVTLKINGKEVASGDVPRVVPARFSATETLDLGSTVSESYVAPHSFSGLISKVDIKLK